MNSFKSTIYLIFIISLITGCNEADPNEPVEIEPITFSELQTQVFNKSCVYGCHDSNTQSGELDLSAGNSYSNMVGVNAVDDSTKKLIDPYNAENSFLIYSLRGMNGAVIMPPLPIKPLTTSEIDRIIKWIDLGALNN